MKRKPSPAPASSVAADPTRWGEGSQGSVASHFTTRYDDIHYRCWHCREPAVFTALEQKRAYEVKQVNINQQRILCTPCWRASHAIAAQLEAHAAAWQASRSTLRSDPAFLQAWLELLLQRDTYVPNRRDTARVNMLRKLLEKAGPKSTLTRPLGA